MKICELQRTRRGPDQKQMVNKPTESTSRQYIQSTECSRTQPYKGNWKKEKPNPRTKIENKTPVALSISPFYFRDTTTQNEVGAKAGGQIDLTSIADTWLERKH